MSKKEFKVGDTLKINAVVTDIRDGYLNLSEIINNTVYEYRYLFTLDEYEWQESIYYYVSKKEFINCEENDFHRPLIRLVQRLTHTKRIRK